MKLMIINGPNINMLGIREKNVYGSTDFDEGCSYIKEEGKKRKHDVTLFQSNIEGEIINFLQKAYFEEYDGVIINPGAFTHYSYAIYDAIKSISIPTVEVHISNIHSREDFRHKSVTAPACVAQLCGCGKLGYVLAMDVLEDKLSK